MDKTEFSQIEDYANLILNSFPKVDRLDYFGKFPASFKKFEKLKSKLSEDNFDEELIKDSFDSFPYFNLRFIPSELLYNLGQIYNFKKKFNKALSVGCGPLIYETYLLRNSLVQKIDAVDISEELISLGEKFFGINEKLKTYSVSFDEFDIASTYDFVYSISSIHWFSQPYKSMEKILKFVETGGVIYITYFKTFFEREINFSPLLNGLNFTEEDYSFIHHSTGKKQSIKVLKIYM